LALTDAFAFSVNVHVRVLLPPLEHAPLQIASRPLLTLRVMEVPAANEAEPLLPTATLMPDGLEITRSPERPVADTVRVADDPPPPLAGVTFSVVDRVVPAKAPLSVTAVDAVTVCDVTVNVALVAPAGIVTLAGTVAAAVLLLDSVTVAPPDGAAALNVAVPCAFALPPAMLDGLTAIEVSVGVVDDDCTVKLRIDDQAPATPLPLRPRTRHQYWRFDSDDVVSCDAVTVVSIVLGEENELESSTCTW
jgi:hypothetical protein